MYARGVRCTDCHNAHTTKLKAEGNAVCTQCHSPAGNLRFSTLSKNEYDDPSHHFHKPSTEGAQCKSCHMIERIYMGVDGRRDHSFRIPRPDLQPGRECDDVPDRFALYSHRQFGVLLLQPTTSAWMYQPDQSSQSQLDAIGNSFQDMVNRLEQAQAEYDIGCEDIIGVPEPVAIQFAFNEHVRAVHDIEQVTFRRNISR